MSELFLDILDPKRQTVFKKLAIYSSKGYLAGGTALALQLGHRKSFDFDIFIPKPLFRTLVKSARSVLGKNSTVRINTGDFTFIRSSEGIEFNFVYYWYDLLKHKIKTTSIPLASITDIAADKAHTVGRRAAWRDYVDLLC